MSSVNESLSSSSSFLLCFLPMRKAVLYYPLHFWGVSWEPSRVREPNLHNSEAKLTFCLCHLVFPVYEKGLYYFRTGENIWRLARKEPKNTTLGLRRYPGFFSTGPGLWFLATTWRQSTICNSSSGDPPPSSGLCTHVIHLQYINRNLYRWKLSELRRIYSRQTQKWLF